MTRLLACMLLQAAAFLPPGAAAAQSSAVIAKIKPCWAAGQTSPPIVQIVVQMNPDGTPSNAEVQDPARYKSDPAYRSAADAALRAIRNPRCQPSPLPPDRYASWKVISFTFDPRER